MYKRNRKYKPSKLMSWKEVTHSNGQQLKEIVWADLADEIGQGKSP